MNDKKKLILITMLAFLVIISVYLIFSKILDKDDNEEDLNKDVSSYISKVTDMPTPTPSIIEENNNSSTSNKEDLVFKDYSELTKPKKDITIEEVKEEYKYNILKLYDTGGFVYNNTEHLTQYGTVYEYVSFYVGDLNTTVQVWEDYKDTPSEELREIILASSGFSEYLFNGINSIPPDAEYELGIGLLNKEEFFTSVDEEGLIKDLSICEDGTQLLVDYNVKTAIGTGVYLLMYDPVNKDYIGDLFIDANNGKTICIHIRDISPNNIIMYALELCQSGITLLK